MKGAYPYFGLSEEQRIMRTSALALIDRVLPPSAIRELDAAGEYPFEGYAALAEAGFMGLPYPVEYGGQGGSFADLAVLVEAMASRFSSLATAYLVSVIYGGAHILQAGSEAQKRAWLPRIADGSLRLCIALTEPDTGSDAAAVQTRAVRNGDVYLVTGQKLYITCAHVADYLMTVVKTDPEAGRRGISLLLVPARAKGVAIRPMETMGRRTTRANEVFFDAVEVPAENLIGTENGAWKQLMRGLNLERLCLAAAGAGNMQHVIDYALAYAKERKAFGQPITKFQAIAHKFADMQCMAETTRLLVRRVAELMDAGLDPQMETAMAKLTATENDFRCADLGLQIMGGAGYTMAHDMQRFFRDARVGTIGGGSSEIQRNIIAGLMGL